MNPTQRFAAALAAKTKDDYWLTPNGAAVIDAAARDFDRELVEPHPTRQLQNGWSLCTSLAVALFDLDVDAVPFDQYRPQIQMVWESLRFARVAVRKPGWKPAP